MNAALVVLGVLVLAGCGGGNEPRTSFGADARYTEAQVVQLAGLTPAEYGSGYVGPGGCEIQDIPTTRVAVETFAKIGWLVVTNPKGDVGMTFHPQPGCRQKLLAAMERVP